jgi:TP901 family phage tail tape measure protein|nr:MAG TPA: minor tail protein [Caudoviricetes sp.]
MANEFKITDIVDKKAFDELTILIAKFNETKEAYVNLTKDLAGGLRVKPGDLKELADKTEKYTGIMNQLITTQNELSDIQGRYKGLLKQIEEQTEKNVKAILEEAKANKLNKDAELAAQKIETERLRQKKLINQENKRYKYTVEEGISALRMEIKTLRDAEEQNKILRAARKEVDITTKEGTETIKKFNEVIDRNDSLIKKNSDSLVQSKMNVGRYKEDIKAATSEILKGNVSLKNMGNLAKSTGGLLKSSMGTGLQEVRIGVGSMIKGMVGAQAVISGIQQMIGLFKSGVRSIIDFEAANSNLSAILGTTSKNIKDLTADAQRLGAATKYTASEATGLQIELAKLGFSRKEILQSTEGILKFAQATGAELPEAAALAGAALRMFNADTSETERYVSAMAIATSKSALSFSYLQTAMPIVGPVAKAFNFQIEDTLALLGKLADAGFDASMSATATRNILLNLADGSGKLAKALGGPVKTLPELVAGLKKLKDQGVDLNTTLELTDKRSVAAFNAFLTAADKIVPLREQITGVKGELDDMANTMGDNVQGAIAGLSSAWEAFMLSFSKSTGLMKDVLDFFAEGLREVAKQLKSYNQMQDDAENEAVARAQKELATSDVLKKNRENMARLYKEKIKEGMSADEAAISAKEEYISSLESTFEIENRAYKTAIHDRKQAEEELNKTGLFYFNSSKGLSKKQLKENVETAIVAAAGKKAIASITESIIEDLKKVDLQQEETNQNLTKELTDKEKKELEKAERERLKIKENYQQSELDLMDEGLEKELAKISFEYTKRIAAIKGNSEEEIKTRENLSKKMQEAIEDKTVSFNLDKEKKDLSNRLELVKEGSEEELELRQRLLLVERAREVYYADKTGEDVVAIQEKYDKKSIDLMAKFADLRNKKLQEQYSMDAIIASASMQEELDALSAKYTKGGLIQREDYEREKAKITQKYAIEQARAAIELAKQQLNTPGLSPDDKLKLERKIAEAEIALAKEVRDAEINAYEDTVKAHQKKMNKISEGIQMASEILNGFSELGSAIFDRKISEIEKEQEANEKSGEEEIERIKQLAEKGAITKEEAEERKRVAEKKTAAKNKELEKKKEALQQKQAKWEKANAISQSIIATALAVSRALPNMVLAALVGALGAAQLATIIAQPIPKYAKGTDNHPGGLAIVGDGGKHEAVVTDRGAYITPNVPTLIDLPRRAKVIPDVDIERRSDFLPPFDRLALYRSMNLRSDIGALMKDAERMGEPITVNVNNDYRKLEREMQSLNRSFEKMAKYQKKAAKEAELRNISSRI